MRLWGGAKVLSQWAPWRPEQGHGAGSEAVPLGARLGRRVWSGGGGAVSAPSHLAVGGSALLEVGGYTAPLPPKYGHKVGACLPLQR